MNDHNSLWSFAVESIKPRVDPFVFLPHHGVIGWASVGLRNLDFATGPSVPRDVAFLHVPDSRTPIVESLV